MSHNSHSHNLVTTRALRTAVPARQHHIPDREPERPRRPVHHYHHVHDSVRAHCVSIGAKVHEHHPADGSVPHCTDAYPHCVLLRGGDGPESPRVAPPQAAGRRVIDAGSGTGAELLGDYFTCWAMQRHRNIMLHIRQCSQCFCVFVRLAGQSSAI